jgi:phosphoribosylglycinamide formyltransferase 1
MNKKRVAVLISGRGSNMTALIEAAKASDYPADVVLVVSNRPEAAGLARANSEGVPTIVIDHAAFHDDREAFEHTLDEALRSHRIDLVCLAGFMRRLTPWFVDRWYGRMLNIHPSLLPQFKGLHTHRRALEAGVKEHGATVHLVVPEVDAGPIVAQERVAIGAGDTEQTLAARVLELEHRLYPRALRALAEGRVGAAASVDAKTAAQKNTPA